MLGRYVRQSADRATIPFTATHLKHMENDLLKAIDLALAGQWNDAHGVVQQYETDSIAAWIHAVLHKIEGDHDNSRYWYRRAGKLEHASDEPKAELVVIRNVLAARPKQHTPV